MQLLAPLLALAVSLNGAGFFVKNCKQGPEAHTAVHDCCPPTVSTNRSNLDQACCTLEAIPRLDEAITLQRGMDHVPAFAWIYRPHTFLAGHDITSLSMDQYHPTGPPVPLFLKNEVIRI